MLFTIEWKYDIVIHTNGNAADFPNPFQPAGGKTPETPGFPAFGGYGRHGGGNFPGTAKPAVPDKCP